MSRKDSLQLATAVARLTRENGAAIRGLVTTYGTAPASWTLQLRREVSLRWQRIHRIIDTLDAAGFTAAGAPRTLGVRLRSWVSA